MAPKKSALKCPQCNNFLPSLIKNEKVVEKAEYIPDKNGNLVKTIPNNNKMSTSTYSCPYCNHQSEEPDEDFLVFDNSCPHLKTRFKIKIDDDISNPEYIRICQSCGKILNEMDFENFKYFKYVIHTSKSIIIENKSTIMDLINKGSEPETIKNEIQENIYSKCNWDLMDILTEDEHIDEEAVFKNSTMMTDYNTPMYIDVDEMSEMTATLYTNDVENKTLKMLEMLINEIDNKNIIDKHNTIEQVFTDFENEEHPFNIDEVTKINKNIDKSLYNYMIFQTVIHNEFGENKTLDIEKLIDTYNQKKMN